MSDTTPPTSDSAPARMTQGYEVIGGRGLLLRPIGWTRPVVRRDKPDANNDWEFAVWEPGELVWHPSREYEDFVAAGFVFPLTSLDQQAGTSPRLQLGEGGRPTNDWVVWLRIDDLRKLALGWIEDSPPGTPFSPPRGANNHAGRIVSLCPEQKLDAYLADIMGKITNELDGCLLTSGPDYQRMVEVAEILLDLAPDRGSAELAIAYAVHCMSRTPSRTQLQDWLTMACRPYGMKDGVEHWKGKAKKLVTTTHRRTAKHAIEGDVYILLYRLRARILDFSNVIETDPAHNTFSNHPFAASDQRALILNPKENKYATIKSIESTDKSAASRFLVCTSWLKTMILNGVEMNTDEASVSSDFRSP
jgi:hypothetical protein